MSEKTKIADFHQDPTYQAAVHARLETIKSQRDQVPEVDKAPGVLSGLAELGGRRAKAALVGVFSVAALAGSADIIAHRIAAIASTHQETRTHVDPNAQNPHSSYSHQTNILTYKQEVIGK